MLPSLILKVSGDGRCGWRWGLDRYPITNQNITHAYEHNSMGSGWIPDLPVQMAETLVILDPFHLYPATDWSKPIPPPPPSPIPPEYEDF